MKKIFTLFVLFFISSFAQIPNPGFENWTGNTPDQWIANNVTGFWETVSKSTTPHSGSAAARGEVVSALNEVIPPYIISNFVGAGFPVNSRPASIKGFYQFNSVGEDLFIITAAFYLDQTAVGVGAFESNTTELSYKNFGADITYFSSETPNNCIITIAVTYNDVPHIGTYFLVDDLEFDDEVVSVNDKSFSFKFSLDQNYPNPFNPTTRINYEVATEDLVTLKIFDLIGNEVTTLVNEVKGPGTHNVDFNAAGLSNGVYFYKLTSGTNQYTRKMILLK